MFRKWINKLKLKKLSSQEKKAKTKIKSPHKQLKKTTLSLFQKKPKEYPNRFLKFYHENKSRLNKERRSFYSEHKSRSLCVRCHKKALPRIVFCSYHQQKQKGYNQKARE
ncbi:hypothetical protein HYX11_04265 [Candidatus Woesearchaeota archaeon]|nr:hypothetical protein [Candidatus Woesearchaeota archaeon]